MNIGVIGCGGIADRRTIPGMLLSNKIRVTAVQDTAPGVARGIAEKYGVASHYTDEVELLRNDSVEAVYIGTPVYAHGPQVLRAADAGRHVLCEKPLALTLKETERVIERCGKRGVVLQVGFMMRYHGFHVRAKELVDKGELGQPVMGRAQLTCWYPTVEDAWRQDPAKGGGGALMDMAIHSVDILRFLFGEVERVSSFNGTRTHGYPVEDSGVVLLGFLNGAYGVCDSFFNIPDEAAKGLLEVYGTKGSLMAEGTISQVAAGRMTAYLAERGKGYDAQQERRDVRPVEVEAPLRNVYTAEVEDFADAVEKKRTPMNSGEEALRNFRIILSAYRSQKTGKAVRVQR
jgi:predicted dehydrogenase